MPRYTTGILTDTIWEQFPNQQKYGDGNYLNINEELLKQLKPNKRGHYDDAVKLPNHPSHPSRGTFSKDGKYFYMSDKGMEDPNLTLFGLADGNDPQATMIYKGGIVLPEITVTKDNNNYIDNTYDQYKFYPDARYQKYQNGGIIQKFQTAGAVLPPELAGMNYANAKHYWEALGDMDPRQKAGIMGNMYEESRMNPKAQNANFTGLTQMSKKQLYPWVSQTYGKGADGELAYIKDYVSGKLNNNKYRGSYGYGSAKYIAAHKGNYTPADSARLFQQYYERNGMRGAKTRQAAAEVIYKLFNKQSEPQLEGQSLSSIQSGPIVEQPDATTTVKPIPSFKLYQQE